MANFYTQGSLVTLTVTILDSLGNQTVTDGLTPPIISISFQTPAGSGITVINNSVMIPATSSMYYFNLDTTLLSTGCYVATITYIVGGQEMVYTPRFDITAFDGTVLLPIDPISRLRIRLRDNDIDPTRWVWSDLDLSEFLQDALDDLNSAPSKTNWYWFNIPLQYIQILLRGGEVFALESMAIKLSHSPITYNDKGVSVDLRGQAQTYLNIATNLREKYQADLLRVKRQLAYGTGYITSPTTPYMSNVPLRAFGRSWGV